eukprot:CAMPEP_0174347042 /NCGR_PEP_ID=MMETSP0811_2-20130205/2974_1 /TAXON_ID=73025 ORGANISM="Eutreptiella gymnastica-like, Strain CCMP1594" /NCGR_SAMPLE_ID=MMETSP0811_2 /ASSEMBLY_ACC=CAM_ASM_000667 /LENGTH=40 /DNA_ID= /DNA_START= /DNA_END= /DNA_ORIENTATION=
MTHGSQALSTAARLIFDLDLTAWALKALGAGLGWAWNQDR